MTLENLPPAAQDTLADAAEEIYQYILNAEYDHISLPSSFGDSYIKWWGRMETQDAQIINALEDLFEKLQEETVSDYERYVRIADGEEIGDESDTPFNTVFGEVEWGDLYFGDYKQRILDCITNHLTEEHKIILLPNDEWTDTESYFDMTPDY